ncbi:SagB/ThcOx family dehydrogenase [candidate division KSB1 bacterium]
MTYLREDTSGIVSLPRPEYSGVTVEQALRERRSIRQYKRDFLPLETVSQLLWSAQGITDPHGWRTAPSAGALYPLEVYVVAGDISGLSPGIYKYLSRQHALNHIAEGDIRPSLATASLQQTFIGDAPVILVISAVFERTTRIYGERGVSYVYMDTGHACQNVHLQAVSMGLGTVVLGAFRDEDVKRLVRMPDEEIPVALMPVGKL